MKTKQNNQKLSKSTLVIIAILALSDVLVMAVPFYLKNVMSSVEISNSLGIKASEFSQANSVYGYVALLSYFAGGYFADKVNLKKLAFWGLAGVGVVGIWYGLIPFIENGKLAQLYIIFALWSFFTCFIFWSALWKLLSEQGTKEENGKLNGIHGSLNGLIGSIVIGIAYLVFYLFGSVWKDTLQDYAFTALVSVFSILILINCILIWFFIPDVDSIEKDKTKIKFELATLKNVLKNYKIWLVTLLIMGVYMYQTGLSVFVTYLDNVLEITAIIVVLLGICRTYLSRAIFSSTFGKMADKSQKYTLFITIGLFIATAITIVAIVVPGFGESSFINMSGAGKLAVQISVALLYTMLGICCWALVTNRWATIYEINIDQKSYATAIGFISFLAFSPDAWFWQIDSVLLKNYGTEAGYSSNKLANQISLIIITVTGLVAAIGGIILMILLKSEEKRRNRFIENSNPY